MIIKFDFYVHGSDETYYERVDEALEAAGLGEDDREEIKQKMQFPFYEMSFKCELDTETGVVTFKEARA